jgi:signal transduction histidine kinase
MKFLNPYSISGRTMIVLLLGLSVSHIASTAFLSHDRQDSVITSGQRLCAERIAATASLLDHRAPEQRAGLVAELDSPSLHVSLSPASTILSDHPGGADMVTVTDVFRPFFGDIPPSRLHVAHKFVPLHHISLWHDILHGFPQGQIMQVSFQLSDGSWTNFDLTIADDQGLWSPHTIGSLLIMLLGILVLGVWATRWVGRPASTFALAADRLGRDVNAPPLPEDGPLEMRQAVAAFNEMQARIRRFVDDRTRMLAAISHDLRSPLTRLRLRADMLPDELTRARMLDDIDEMETMVASALDFARGESGDEKTEAVDLAATLATICDNASDVGLAASYAWEGRLLYDCRPKALKRALTNLVENAARYGHRAEVRGHIDEGTVTIVIDDDGPGIPEAEIEAVFEPFYRLDDSRNRKSGGVGLGMTVARSIIRAHGGDIHLLNRPNGGLRATVTLPPAKSEGQPLS